MTNQPTIWQSVPNCFITEPQNLQSPNAAPQLRKIRKVSGRWLIVAKFLQVNVYARELTESEKAMSAERAALLARAAYSSERFGGGSFLSG